MDCQLHDVGHRCFLQLPKDEDVWTIGLSVTEELTGCVAGLVHTSDLVVQLFSIQQRGDGHWITPHPDFPLVLNGEQLQVSTLISHGSIIMVADHTLTYTIKPGQSSTQIKPEHTTSNHSTSKSGPPVKSGPPPKPARHGNNQLPASTPGQVKTGPVFESSSDTLTEEDVKPQKVRSLKAQAETQREHEDIEKSVEVFMSLKDSLVNTDIELLEHLNSPEQMADVCSSYLLQFLMSQGFCMSMTEMDSIHKAMQVVGLGQAYTLLDFLRGMQTKDVISDNDQGIFLKLLTDVLFFTMDMETICETCMKTLLHLTAVPTMARFVSHHGLVPIVHAAAAVYPNNVHIQILVCRLYQNVVEAHQRGRCPVKEAAVDLIVRGLTIHQMEKPYLRAALRVILALARLHHTQGGRVTSEVGRLSVAMLSHMEEHCLLLVQTIHSSAAQDNEILSLCVEIMEILLTHKDGGSYDTVDISDTVQVPRSESPTEGDQLIQGHITQISAPNKIQQPHQSQEELEDQPDISDLYAKVHKKQAATEDSNKLQDDVQELNNGEDINKEPMQRPHEPIYEDIIDITDDAEESIIEMVDCEVYGTITNGDHGDTQEIDNSRYQNPSDTGEDQSECENSQTESELEMTLGSGTHEALLEGDRDISAVEGDSNRSTSNSESRDIGDGNVKPTDSETKVKKSALIKKKIGGYISKMKPKKRAKKYKFTDGLAFKEGSKSPVSIEHFENSIDIAFCSLDESPETIVKPADNTYSFGEQGDPDKSETLTHQTDDSSSVASEFNLPPIPQSDSDSIESEFRLSASAKELDHELSESEDELQLCEVGSISDVSHQGVDETVDVATINHVGNQGVDKAVDEEQTSMHSGGDGTIAQPESHHSVALSGNSSNSELTFGPDSLPNSRSEYSEEITRSMQSRTGKKVAWVSTLRNIYEKPTSKWKNVIGSGGKKVETIANPKYDDTRKDKQPKVLMTQYRSTEDLSRPFGQVEEEYSGTESEMADANTGNTLERQSSKKLSKFQMLKLKNQRDKMKRYPWTSSPNA